MKQGPLANASYQGKLRNREQQHERQRKRDLAAIMGTPEGRRFMYDLLFLRCNLMGVYPGSDSGIYRHEGRRMLAVELAGQIQSELADSWVMMIKEHLAEQTDDAVIRSAAEASAEKEDGDE